MISIAIDGPSGAGKSSVAKAAAKRFGFVYVDTGAIYRTIGLAAFLRGIDTKDSEKVIAMLPEPDIELKYDDTHTQHMYLDGADVSDRIRQNEVSMFASNVSAIPEVRDYLTEMQRDLAKRFDVIMDGRDIGTVILPDADLKIFLTASVGERAKRRFAELSAKGSDISYEEVLSDMKRRDEQDTNRSAAPLKMAEDAVLLDTTGMGIGESIDAVCALIREKKGKLPVG